MVVVGVAFVIVAGEKMLSINVYVTPKVTAAVAVIVIKVVIALLVVIAAATNVSVVAAVAAVCSLRVTVVAVV